MKTQVTVQTVDQLLEQARFRNSFEVLPKGDTFKNLSTIAIIPIPGGSNKNIPYIALSA